MRSGLGAKEARGDTNFGVGDGMEHFGGPCRQHNLLGTVDNVTKQDEVRGLYNVM